MVTRRCATAGAKLSGWSSAADSVEENSLTAIRARAMHRGQYSTVSQLIFGLIVNPQRGQLRNGEAPSIIESSQ